MLTTAGKSIKLLQIGAVLEHEMQTLNSEVTQAKITYKVLHIIKISASTKHGTKVNKSNRQMFKKNNTELL